MIIRCVYVCVCLYMCVCVALPLLLAGVRWQAGHVTGCQLAFYWSSHTVHNITISWWARLGPSHALSCSSDVIYENRTMSVLKHLNLNRTSFVMIFLTCFGFWLVLTSIFYCMKSKWTWIFVVWKSKNCFFEKPDCDGSKLSNTFM